MANSKQKKRRERTQKATFCEKMVCICASKLQIFDRTINPEYKVEIATAFRVAVNAGLFWQFYIHQKLHPFHRIVHCKELSLHEYVFFGAYCVSKLIVCHFSQWALEGGFGLHTSNFSCAKIAFTHVYT